MDLICVVFFATTLLLTATTVVMARIIYRQAFDLRIIREKLRATTYSMNNQRRRIVNRRSNQR
jgi:hypothetical protein